jgi:anaerobic magnesium-protoporphyrin IX monomethyl ester cyclase
MTATIELMDTKARRKPKVSEREAAPASPSLASRHLVLINPPALEGFTNERTYSGGIGVSRKLKPGEVDYPMILPIDFLYTAAVAERAGARVTLVDLLVDRFHGEKAELFCLDKIGPAPDRMTWVGVRLSIPSLLQDLAFANRLKVMLPDSHVFVFGTVIMATIDHWIADCHVDFLVYGEPEAMIDSIMAADDYSTVPGVIVPSKFEALTGDDLYNRAKNITRYDGWVKVENLNAMPRPAWHLLDMARYDPAGSVSEVGVFVQASRGCPIGCTMCPYMLLEGLPWRSNDLDPVVDEIEYLNKTFGIYRVRFRDPNFGFNRKYARELCEKLIARGVKLAATVETSVEVFDEDNLRKMYDAGIRTITTGIETADEECMNDIGQKFSVNARLKEKIALCHQIGFHIYGTFCLGTPHENWNTVEKTWRFANELDVESGFTVMTPFPGTPMYWSAIEEGLVPKRMRFSDWNSYTSTMRTNFLTTHDLDMARWWSRMETIIPYRLKRAREQGAGAVARFYVKHVPHFLWRQYCRAYVWFRKLQQANRAHESNPRLSQTPAASPAE